MITRQNILQAKKDTIQIFDDLLANFEAPISDIQVSFTETGDILVEWDSNYPVKIDVFYYSPSVHAEWQHRYSDYVAEIDSKDEKVIIGIGDHSEWKVKIVAGFWESDVITVSKEPEIEKPEPPEEPEIPNKQRYIGLWDSWNYDGNEFNLIKSKGLTIPENLEKDQILILSVSHRWKGKRRDKWQRMISWMSDEIAKAPASQTYVLIQDEPLSNHHSFSQDEVQFLYDELKTALPDYRFGFSFTRKSVRQRIEEGLKMDFAILPLYLFSGETTKEDFDSYFDEHVAIARQKMQVEEIFVLGQGFYNRPGSPRDWTRPVPESPYWYAEAIERNGLTGILWWVYQSNEDVVGLDQMDALFRTIQQVSLQAQF